MHGVAQMYITNGELKTLHEVVKFEYFCQVKLDVQRVEIDMMTSS